MKLAARPPLLRLARARGGSAAATAWTARGWAGAGQENRYSRRVALLKRILPAIGLALLLLITLWPRLSPLWDRIRLGFPAIYPRGAGGVREVNPRARGPE